VSSATDLLGTHELVALPSQSRAANERRGVTGMLLYRDGNILPTNGRSPTGRWGSRTDLSGTGRGDLTGFSDFLTSG
jgi:hypothetical protein